jgi:hypothetical protein
MNVDACEVSEKLLISTKSECLAFSDGIVGEVKIQKIFFFYNHKIKR